jgi:hypothetical protein
MMEIEREIETLRHELLSKGADLIEILKLEIMNTDIDLLYIRRPWYKRLYDKMVHGVPYWTPVGMEYSEWLLENKPELYRSSASTVIEDERKSTP